MNYITQVTLDRYNEYKDGLKGVNENSKITFGDEQDKALLNEIKGINSETLIIVFGIGNGEYIEKVLKKMGKFNRLLIIEPDREKLNYLMKLDNFSEIIEDPRLFIYLYKEKWELWDWLNSIIDQKQFNNVKFVIYSNYKEAYLEALVDVLKLIKDMLNKELLNFNTSKYLGIKFMKAYINNMKNIVDSKPINTIKNSMKGIPAVVVSGGPSLKKNIDVLKNFQDKVVIICGSRTLEPLLQRDIIPDYLCVLDTSDAMYQLTQDLSYENIPIVFQQSTNNKILEHHKKNNIFFKNKSFETYIDEIVDYSTDSLFIGGSVAHTSADLGIYLGCSPIIFIGQDLALTNNEQYAFPSKHISGGYTYDKIIVEDINGMNVETSTSLNDFRIAFEDYFRLRDDMTFIDCTEGGAKIEGSLILTLEDALNMFTENITKNVLLEKNNEDLKGYYNREIVVKNIERIIRVYEKVEKKCKSGVKICKKIKDIKDDSEMLLNMRKIYDINKFIEECEELDFIDYATNNCFDSSFSLFRFEKEDDSNNIDKSKKVALNFNFIYEYFLMCFKEIIPLLRTNLEKLKN